jgi:hypothetical protein
MFYPAYLVKELQMQLIKVAATINIVTNCVNFLIAVGADN